MSLDPANRAPRSALASHRERLSRRGFVRVEVRVQRGDALLVRSVATALSDPVRQDEARRLLEQNFGVAPVGLKALLAAAPLEDVEIERDRSPGRTIDL